jgi:pilus assembly protein CpaB
MVTGKRAVVVLLAVAISLGLIASTAVFKYLRQVEQKQESLKVATQPLVVASMDIAKGETLTDNKLKVVSWPEKNIPNGCVKDKQAVVGKFVRADIYAEEPILSHKLITGDLGRLIMRIPEGKRAMTVRVNEASGVAGFICPDSRVDVLVTMDLGNKKERASKTILQNVPVLAIGQKMEQKDDKPVVVPTVTLELSLEEAEKLNLASQEGKISLALRNIHDSNISKTRGVVKSALLNINRRSRSTKSSRSYLKVEIIRGDERLTKKF